MPNPYFQFKQFTVWHDKCAMKVGTDGVLLGAWANVSKAENILDVGCGSGLIALMLAQRSQAWVDAIDIDADAALQTRENIARSPFAGRMQAFHQALQDFRHTSGEKRYDLIVSNPPYFISSLKCPDEQRATARHTDTLSVYDLLSGSRDLLKADGHIALVLPYEQRDMLLETAQGLSLHLQRETAVRPTPGAAPKRLLADFALMENDAPEAGTLTIEITRHQYTEEYIALTRNFYLKM